MNKRSLEETVEILRAGLGNLLTEEADITKAQSNKFFASVFTQKAWGQMSETDTDFPREQEKILKEVRFSQNR